MKTILKTTVPMFVISALPLQGLAADNIEFIPANGASFIVTDSTGQQRVLEVTADGDILVNGQLLDVEPPSISMIVEDTENEYQKLLTISATDNVGIASTGFQRGYPGMLDQEFYLKGEKSISLGTREVNLPPEKGARTEIWAVAIDYAGNRTVQSVEFVSP